MTAYHPATFRAVPLRLFFLQEPLHAMFFDESEVLNHAHMVLAAVALIEGFQTTAGKSAALMAKPNKSLPQQTALLAHEGTVLTAWQATGAVLPSESLLIQVVFHRQIAEAQAAVHSTGSNQFCFLHRAFLHQTSRADYTVKPQLGYGGRRQVAVLLGRGYLAEYH